MVPSQEEDNNKFTPLTFIDNKSVITLWCDGSDIFEQYFKPSSSWSNSFWTEEWYKIPLKFWYSLNPGMLALAASKL